MQPGSAISQVIVRQGVGQFKSSLKLIYEAQNFMISIKESEEYLSVDIEICVHMITFVALWKMKKHSDSAYHVEAAARLLNHVIQGFSESKMSKNSSQNLYCLIVMSLAALKVKVNSDVQGAKELCEDCKGQLASNSLCQKLIGEFNFKISEKKGLEDEWLVTEVYQKILFVTTFMPLIAPNTPLIKLSDLENEAEKGNFIDDLGSMFSHKAHSSKDRLGSSKVSKKGSKFNPRTNGMPKPWWENNKFIENSITSYKSNNDKRFRSEPRQSRKSSLYQEGNNKFSPALLAPKIRKPYSRESFYSEFSRDREVRNLFPNVPGNDKELIMLEFNPEYEKTTGECQVQLVPLTVHTSYPKRKRDLTPQKKFGELHAL